MKNREGEILYIGKARSLKKRVASYLRDRGQMPKIQVLLSKVGDLDYVETPTEVDALLLEAELIRKFQPRYNKELKDDKSYPLLKITGDEFPRLHVTRNKTDKKALYYGPYTDAKLLREAVTLINTVFPIRKCRKLPKKACLYYHIGQCLAPCIKPEVKPEYHRLVNEVKGFLGGGKRSFMDYLSDRMFEAAKELRFEDAQFFKEQIEALGRLKKKRFSPRMPAGRIGLSATLELKHLLKMGKLPERIVCFDVSNIQGEEAVASRVAFYRELPDKLEYRRYKIKTVTGIDDYAMIQEAVGRMLAGLKEGRESFLPDLIVIDGGKGHLNAARATLEREGFQETELASIAKQFETVYSARLGGEVSIPRDSPALHLLEKVRDEAHRFAITYHRSLKEKQMSRSVLDEIPGIGERRKRILLEQFDSIEVLKRTGVGELAGLPGMNRRVAEKVLERLKNKTNNS
ncbi:MAG: excinuclease ABC subunit UvrC [Candidatus Omnitrophica bacterium]|nr:excinuclease ABC subunit UvrC [Candidatus Omnitrophota bacterium]